MHAHLYFICPTDYLESVINNSFEQRNFFYTSLGNSFDFDHKTMRHLQVLISKYGINDISFVLSESNAIIKDALTNQGFSKTLDLGNLYNEIKGRKEYSAIVWQQNNCLFTIISHYLNKKIQELRLHLDDLNLYQIEIHGKIYSQKENVFNDIYADLICRDYFSLN